MLKKSIRQNPGMLLNPLQCIGHLPTTKNYLAPMSLVLRLRNLVRKITAFLFCQPLYSLGFVLSSAHGFLCCFLDKLGNNWPNSSTSLLSNVNLQAFTSKFDSVYTISFSQFHITGREIFIGSGISSLPIMHVKRWSCVGPCSLKKDYRKDILGKSEG